MRIKTFAIATMSALSLGMAAGEASAHAVSIGYENAGPGAVNVWLGTYSTGHAAIVNEGSMQLAGVLGTAYGPVIIPFTLLAGPGVASKPAGLVDGVTNFYAPNGSVGGPGNLLPLVSTEAPFNLACAACGPVDRWQGATFNGLSAGDYQFTWIPIANPTLQWDILNLNMNGVFHLSGTVVGTAPEPATLALLGLALAGLGLSRRRKLH